MASCGRLAALLTVGLAVVMGCAGRHVLPAVLDVAPRLLLRSAPRIPVAPLAGILPSVLGHVRGFGLRAPAVPALHACGAWPR